MNRRPGVLRVLFVLPHLDTPMSRLPDNPPRRQLHLNVNILHSGFVPSAWRLPESDPHAFVDVAHYLRVAQIAEAGKLDAVFLADTLVAPNSSGLAATGSLEPIVLLSVEQGACWYCPELVREAHVRERRTASIRGVVPNRPPMASNGDADHAPALGAPDPAAGARACLAMRKAGITSTSPGHPSLLAAIAEGATVDMFATAARRGAVSGKGFAWVVATVRGELMGANRSASRARAFVGGGG